MKTPPTYDELEDIINRLGITPYHLLRTNEDIFKDNYKDFPKDSTDWISIMILHPVLIQRPIVITGNNAIIVRDEESLIKLKDMKQ